MQEAVNLPEYSYTSSNLVRRTEQDGAARKSCFVLLNQHYFRVRNAHLQRGPT